MAAGAELTIASLVAVPALRLPDSVFLAGSVSIAILRSLTVGWMERA